MLIFTSGPQGKNKSSVSTALEAFPITSLYPLCFSTVKVLSRIAAPLKLQQGRNVYATNMDLGFVKVREGLPAELFKMELMPEMIRRFRKLQDLKKGIMTSSP